MLMMPIHLHVFLDPPFPGMVYVRRTNKPYRNILIQNVTERIELRTKQSEQNARQWRAACVLRRKRRKHETQRDDSDPKPLNAINRSLQNDARIQCAPNSHRAEGYLEQAAATVGEASDHCEERSQPNRSDNVPGEVTQCCQYIGETQRDWI